MRVLYQRVDPLSEVDPLLQRGVSERFQRVDPLSEVDPLAEASEGGFREVPEVPHGTWHKSF